MSSINTAKYKKLTIDQAKEFIVKNKDKLEFNFFMDYEDYYNKALMNCKNVYDKDWSKRIVIRHNVFDDYYELNVLYEEWL